MVLMIDNYDSFTYNVVQYLSELGAEVTVHRNDALTVDEAIAIRPESIVLSPGPCTPNEAGICVDLIKANQNIPLLGICLGHQCIGAAFGGAVVRAEKVMHGKLSSIHHDGSTLFTGLKSNFTATRYHSLVVETESLPECLGRTAWTVKDDGEVDEIMGFQHVEKPIFGVQFHPESIMTEYGHELLGNFLRIASN